MQAYPNLNGKALVDASLVNSRQRSRIPAKRWRFVKWYLAFNERELG